MYGPIPQIKRFLVFNPFGASKSIAVIDGLLTRDPDGLNCLEVIF